MLDTRTARPGKPTPDFPLFAHGNGQWAKKSKGKLRYYGPWANPDAALGKYRAEKAQQPVSVTASSAPAKPKKPHPDYPLYAHRSGQWAKKVRGRTRFFGKWADPEAALQKWVAEKDALLAGRKPTAPTDGLTIRDLANAFLIHKQERVATGELKDSTFMGYRQICDRVIAAFGKERLVADLRPDDFAKLRKVFAKGVGLVTLSNGITRSRVLFKYATDTYNIPAVYGKEFAKPDKKSLRKARREKGPRMFQPADLRKIIDGAGGQLKAMILLGINCGFGNTDVGSLPLKALDLEKGWIDYPRPKTGIQRRCPLWPETVEALRQAIASRPKPSPAFVKQVFITVQGRLWEPRIHLKGEPWRDDPVAKATAKLLKELHLHRPGLGFYALRHTFQTIGEKSRDKDAVAQHHGARPNCQ